MDEGQLRLDGNAAAGLLREVFAGDVTGSPGACAACGVVAQLGAQHLYMATLAPGAVLRCSSCDNVLVVVVRTESRLRVGLAGLRWVDLAAEA